MYRRFFLVLTIFALPLVSSCDDDNKSLCGNGVLDPGETCDPAMDVYADVCNQACQLTQFCGNGVVEGTEECDDGNVGNGDGCTRECRIEVGCGNGFIDVTVDENGRLVAEECDDNNLSDNDACSSTCTLISGTQTCGNGLLEFPEDCDDGNTTDGDGCSSTCHVESGCGDGIFNFLLEECDDGNTRGGDGCSSKCKLEFDCGDGVCDVEMGEACEVCPADCCPDCGDGILDSGEECDDGNNEHFDGCSAGCFDEDGMVTCGNGIWELGEECDDGNQVNGDGCDSSCKREFIIGDGTCEWEKGETCRLSLADCCPNCGDGTIQSTEQCDGNALNGKTCESLCYDGGTLSCHDYCEFDVSQCTGTGPVCGDNDAECSEQCDGTDLKNKTCQSFGYAEGTLACTGNCTWDVSGCSGFMYYLMADFDDGITPLDWTINGSNWALGSPTAGPSSVPSTPYCIGTVLTGDHPNGMTYAADNVRLPPIDLSSATSPVLTFQGWMDAESCCDGGTVQYSTNGGLSWSDMPDSAVSPSFNSSSSTQWTGTTYSTWTLFSVDLSSFVGEVLYLRFAFESDSSIVNAGWFIDDVLISEAGL